MRRGVIYSNPPRRLSTALRAREKLTPKSDPFSESIFPNSVQPVCGASFCSVNPSISTRSRPCQGLLSSDNSSYAPVTGSLLRAVDKSVHLQGRLDLIGQPLQYGAVQPNQDKRRLLHPHRIQPSPRSPATRHESFPSSPGCEPMLPELDAAPASDRTDRSKKAVSRGLRTRKISTIVFRVCLCVFP